MKEIVINTETIKLDQFLKWAGIVETGGKGKRLIQTGKIRVNGEIEKKRGSELTAGDIVEVIDSGEKYRVRVD
ncbi:MAG: RNA-binding S4 domain-containing protein [Halanaerobiales bacterium]